MPKNAMKSRGESINHINAIRPRIIGEGNLLVAAYAPGGDNTDVLVETIVPYVMSATNTRQPVLLANVRQQRVSFEFKVTEINEWFQCNRIVIFMKPLFTSFPGREG